MRPAAEVRLAEAVAHGRYLVSGPAGAEEPRGLLVGFHGYGENAERHLEALLALPGLEGWTLAAVQALHPFYAGRSGEVVASWMTRLDREHAIADNVRYVGGVVKELRRKSDGPLVYAGFSQGTAMAYRAAWLAGYPCRGLIALAGDVPPELAGRPLAQAPRVLIGRGLADDWYTEEKLAFDCDLLRAQGAEVTVCRFAGAHEWTADFRAAAAAFLRRLLST